MGQKFSDYLDGDKKAQEAIDMCFDEQCQNIDKFVKEIKENIPPARSLGDVLKSLCKR